MQKLIYIAFLSVSVFATISASAQNRPFDKFKFEDGGYTLAGVFEHYKDHPVQKEVGEFYTEDIDVLNEIKRAWNFPRPQKLYACGYHYYVVLLKDGKKVDDLSINLECNQVVTGKGSRYFRNQLLTSFSARFRPLFQRSSDFLNVAEARSYWQKSIADGAFVFAYPPNWLKYEGTFRFRSQCPSKDKNCYYSGHDAEVLMQVRSGISSAYPGEPFELKTSGGSSTGEVFFEITCNRSLEEKFGLFDRWNKEMFGKWQPFPLTLDSYWKVK